MGRDVLATVGAAVLDERAGEGDVVADLEGGLLPGIEAGAGHAGSRVTGRRNGIDVGRRIHAEHPVELTGHEGVGLRRHVGGVDYRVAHRGSVRLRAQRIGGEPRRVRTGHAHREAGLGQDRRVVLIDLEPVVRCHGPAVATTGATGGVGRIVDLDASAGALDAGGACNLELTGRVVDVADVAGARVQVLLRDVDQPGDVAIAAEAVRATVRAARVLDPVADDLDLVGGQGRRSVVHRHARGGAGVGRGSVREQLLPRQGVGRKDDDRLLRHDHLVPVDQQGAARVRVGDVVDRGRLEEAGDVELRARRHVLVDPCAVECRLSGARGTGVAAGDGVSERERRPKQGHGTERRHQSLPHSSCGWQFHHAHFRLGSCSVCWARNPRKWGGGRRRAMPCTPDGFS